MIIGGYDWFYKIKNLNSKNIDSLIIFLYTDWPNLIVEHEEREWFIYENSQSLTSWNDNGCIPENNNQLIHIILGNDGLSFVVGSENSLSLKMVQNACEKYTRMVKWQTRYA